MSEAIATALPLTAGDLCRMLRLRYPANAYALMFEVGDSTGFGCRRHLDAIVMSLWPSRGLELIGCEIKCSRSDWKRELENPAKAAPHIRYLHRFYLVVSTDKIVQPGELPATWGLMIANGKALRVVTEAPLLTPEPVGVNFLAAILRRAQEINPQALAAAKQEALVEQAAQLVELQTENRRLLRLADSSRLKSLAAFETAAGITLDEHGYGWNGNYRPEIAGEMLRVLLAGESELRLAQMRNWEKALRGSADALRLALDGDAAGPGVGA